MTNYSFTHTVKAIASNVYSIVREAFVMTVTEQENVKNTIVANILEIAENSNDKTDSQIEALNLFNASIENMGKLPVWVESLSYDELTALDEILASM